MEKTGSEQKKEKGFLGGLSKWVGAYIKTEMKSAKTERKVADTGA